MLRRGRFHGRQRDYRGSGEMRHRRRRIASVKRVHCVRHCLVRHRRPLAISPAEQLRGIGDQDLLLVLGRLALAETRRHAASTVP